MPMYLAELCISHTGALNEDAIQSGERKAPWLQRASEGTLETQKENQGDGDEGDNITNPMLSSAASHMNFKVKRR